MHWALAAGAGIGPVFAASEDRRVSLNTYARKNGIPCGNRTHVCGFADRRPSSSGNGTFALSYNLGLTGYDVSLSRLTSSAKLLLINFAVGKGITVF